MAEVTGVDQGLEPLLDHLKRTRGFDFTGYKRSSLQRRIQKRMEEAGVATYTEYVDRLEVDSNEFSALFNTILINVTGFFRDPPTWEYLRDELVPDLLGRMADDAPVRIWCAGCASGEEAYTVAMCFAEAMGEDDYLGRVKIYATDADEEALAHARAAVFDAKALEAVPEPLRERYFVRQDERFAFRPDIRRAVIFGRNDLVQDAPISRIDLLVCRNTLMYFNAEAQASILARFHFALRGTGRLLLGKSEMLITHSDLFAPVDLKRRVFAKVPRTTLRDRLMDFADGDGDGAVLPVPDAMYETALDAVPMAQIVVDQDGLVRSVNARARQLFDLAPQDVRRPLRDLTISYRPVDVRSLIDQAMLERRPVTAADVHWQLDGAERIFDVQVHPLSSAGEIVGASVTYEDVTAARSAQEELDRHRRELETAYEELQTTVEELETTNEELQSTNEELETTNEELQSTNEELETMNEELQSTNEELETTNSELRRRGEQLDEVNAFLEAILTSMGAAVAVLDAKRTVRIWNAFAEKLWGVRAGEAEGESLFSLDIGLPIDAVRQPIRDALDGGTDRQELEVDAVNRRGRRIGCRVTVLALRRDEQLPTGVLLLMEDLGER